MPFFFPALFRLGIFRPGTFRPGFLFRCGPFVLRVCRSQKEGGGCSLGGKVRHMSGKGKSLDCHGREGTALVGEGKTHVREGKAIWSEGRGTSSGAGRLGRRGGHPVAGGPLRGAFPAERVPAGPEWRPDNTNRIKNTRFGLSFNEKFGMFVHMNRIRLAEVTLIGHATGSLSGPCAGRGTGGENIWCFMSPAR